MGSSNISASALGARVRAARAVLGISQKDLASLAGVSHPVLNRIERQESSPRLSTVEAIEAALRDQGIRFSVDAEGNHAMYFSAELIENLAAKQASGHTVTSRGGAGGRPKRG